MEKFSPLPSSRNTRDYVVQITAENHTWLLTWNIWNWRVFPCKSDTLFVYSVSVCSLLLKELTYFLTYLSKNWHFTQTTDNRIVRKSIYTWRFSKIKVLPWRAVWKWQMLDKNWHVGLKLHTWLLWAGHLSQQLAPYPGLGSGQTHTFINHGIFARLLELNIFKMSRSRKTQIYQWHKPVMGR